MLQLDFVAPNLTATLEGEIDHHSSQYLRTRIDEAVEATHPKRLTMDFSQVSSMDSSGIGLVMGRFKLMKQLGGSVEVTGASGSIKRVMTLAGLDKLAPIH